MSHVPHWMLKWYLPEGMKLSAEQYWKVQNELLDPAGYTRGEWKRIALSTAVFLIIGAVVMVAPVVLWSAALGEDLAAGIGVVMIVLLSLVYSHWAMKDIFVPRLARALEVAGYEVCESCNHWLYGLSDDVKVCPECAAPRRGTSTTTAAT